VTDKWCKWPAITAIIFLLTATGSRASVPLAQDLRDAGRRAEQSCAPVLLEFAAEYCDYCVLLEREILDPTLLDKSYDQRVVMRKLLIDGATTLRDFDDLSTDAASIAGRYKVWVTPTVLFVDSHGEELAERLVGVSSVDFYGGYLDAALDQSRQRLRELGRCD
jgi:thioredoxin-related protein